MNYKVITNYKYMLLEDTVIAVLTEGYFIEHEYITLLSNGFMILKKGYAWDGPSGPTIDTKTFMQGALIHDAFYQLIRLGLLPKSFRKIADNELYVRCLCDGMNRFRAWYVHKFVRLFGWLAIRKKYGIYLHHK